jgi:hypothetical protein
MSRETKTSTILIIVGSAIGVGGTIDEIASPSPSLAI